MLKLTFAKLRLDNEIQLEQLVEVLHQSSVPFVQWVQPQAVKEHVGVFEAGREILPFEWFEGVEDGLYTPDYAVDECTLLYFEGRHAVKA